MSAIAGSIKTISPNDCSVTGRLKAFWDTPDPWSYNLKDLAPLHLQAMRSRFEERRKQLRVLNQRATDTGTENIQQLADIVPLLFSHTNNKSYSPTFVAKGRWDLMTRWLGNLSVLPVDNIDLTGVQNIDDWVNAARAAGHLLLASSGTSGHTSFVNYTAEDENLSRWSLVKSFAVTAGQEPENKFQTFLAGPKHGLTMVSHHIKFTAQLFAAPGGDHYISERSTSITDLDRMAALRRAMAAGTATPDMIENAQSESTARAAEMERSVNGLLEKILEHRKEPILIMLLDATLWRLVEFGRARGIPDGDFHPDILIRTGGGTKGTKLPSNFKEEIYRFIGADKSRYIEQYGMTELTSQFIKCRAGRYHFPPTVVPLILDKSGNSLIEQRGVIDGRGAFFDTAMEGYWGGVISGDRLKVDFDPCPCGRCSPSIIEVNRYSDLPEGDDKLTCAGHIDTYIRGFTIEGDEK